METLFKKLLLAVFVCVAVLTSCKKTLVVEIDTTKSMSGAIRCDAPSYVQRGDTITMMIYGVKSPEKPTYKWYLSSFCPDTVLAQKITLKMPDSLAIYTFSYYASAEGYYSLTGSSAITVIDTTYNVSLIGIKRSDKSIIDWRDGKFYNYTTIGHLDWFTNNLAYAGKGINYKSSPVTESFFGRFYDWEEATGGDSGSGLGGGPQGICPDGWKIPTNEDWEDLATATAGKKMIFADKWEGLGDMLSADAYFAGDRMWPYSPDNAHKNTVGWNGLPLGNSKNFHEESNGYGEYAFWWSASEKDADKAFYRYIYYNYGNFPMNYTGKEGFGATVRCVRIAQ